MKHLMLAACAAVFPISAPASTECARISDDAQRLECYDLEYRVPADAPTLNGADKWEVRSESSDIDKSTRVIMLLSSEEPHRDRLGREEYLQLRITCEANRTTAEIQLPGTLMSEMYGSPLVAYRVDGRPVQRKRFGVSDEDRWIGLYHGNAISWLTEVIGGKRLHLRARPHSGSEIEVEFDVAGMEKAIQPLRDACRW